MMGGFSVEVVFSSIPENFEAFKATASETDLNEERVAALLILALCMYAQDSGEGLKAIAHLKEDALTNRDIAFLRDRLADKKYLPFSYFAGATPENKYAASAPYAVVITGDKLDAAGPGYKKVFVACGGADTPRPVTLVQKGNRYYLWEYSSILSGIRRP